MIKAVFLFMLATIVFAQQNIQRSLNLNRNPSGITVDSLKNHSSEGSHDVVRFFIGTSRIPHWLVNNHVNAESEPLESNRLSLWKLIEYSEDDGIDGFLPGKDARVSFVKLWTEKWSDFKIAPAKVNEANILEICSTTQRKSPQVTLCTYVVDRSTIINGVEASPNTLKWSMQITNYPFFRNNSRLALKVSFDSFSEVEDNETPNSIETQGPNCYSTSQVVRSNVFKGDVQEDLDKDFPQAQDSDEKFIFTNRIVYYSFITDCQPKTLTWNPSFGSVASSDSTSIETPAIDAPVASIDSASDPSLEYESLGSRETFSFFLFAILGLYVM